MADDFEIAREKIWYDTEKLDGKLGDFIGEYLIFDQGKDNHNMDSYFVVGHFNEPPNPDEPDIFHTNIMFFKSEESIEDRKPEFSFDISNLKYSDAKEIVENTAEHFKSLENFSFDGMKEHIDLQIYKEQQLEKLEKHFEEYPDTSKNNNLEKENIMSDKFEWIKGRDGLTLEEGYADCDYLKTSFNLPNLKNNPYYFLVAYLDNSHQNVGISFYTNPTNVIEGRAVFNLETKGDIDSVKKMVEKTVEYISDLIPFSQKMPKIDDIKEDLHKQIYIEKTLFWDKTLGEQSASVKKAIDPLLTWEMAYHNEYSKDENRKRFWEAKGKDDPNFIKEHLLKKYPGNLYDEIKRLGYTDRVKRDNYIKSLGIDTVSEYSPTPTQETSAHKISIANKTGYVQGVCESVLAFNTDENRKIMSEDTMSFLSKKILSEMHVTKDMAQKFANPETYKALEQYVFVQKQEQHLEQTQSQGFKH